MNEKIFTKYRFETEANMAQHKSMGYEVMTWISVTVIALIVYRTLNKSHLFESQSLSFKMMLKYYCTGLLQVLQKVTEVKMCCKYS